MGFRVPSSRTAGKRNPHLSLQLVSFLPLPCKGREDDFSPVSLLCSEKALPVTRGANESFTKTTPSLSQPPQLNIVSEGGTFAAA